MSKVGKLCTGLTGMRVADNPHHTLGVLYGKIQRTLEKMPSHAAYRKHTEQVLTERSEILKSNQNISSVEEKIGCGQIEEVIIQAEKELVLARKMLIWKAWEPLMKEAPANQWAWPPTK